MNRQTSLSDLDRNHIADAWNRLSRSDRRVIVRRWWRYGPRFADTFGDHWRRIMSSLSLRNF